jgi:hypothetical protein
LPQPTSTSPLAAGRNTIVSFGIAAISSTIPIIVRTTAKITLAIITADVAIAIAICAGSLRLQAP